MRTTHASLSAASIPYILKYFGTRPSAEQDLFIIYDDFLILQEGERKYANYIFHLTFHNDLRPKNV